MAASASIERLMPMRALGAERRPQPCLLARRRRLRSWVADRLGRNWSPRQVAVGLKHTFPHDRSMRVSHETLYRSLFIQARNVLKKELVSHLRRAGFMRRPRTQAIGHPSIVEGLSIHQRPAEIEDRAVPGHWEGDLLMGGAHSQIATLVERHSRYVMLVKIDSKDTVTVTKALKSKIRQLPTELRRSLTWDRGSEITNGLLRQYFPKGHDLSQISQAKLNQVARELNERPRETLNWRTPLAALKATVASTG